MVGQLRLAFPCEQATAALAWQVQLHGAVHPVGVLVIPVETVLMQPIETLSKSPAEASLEHLTERPDDRRVLRRPIRLGPCSVSRRTAHSIASARTRDLVTSTMI